jgi:hypothetical protein
MTTPIEAAPIEAAAVELPAPADRPPRRRKTASTTPAAKRAAKARAAKTRAKRASSTATAAGKPTRARKTGKPPRRPTNDERVRSALTQGLALIAFPVALMNERDGEILAEAIPTIADRAVVVLRKYPALYKFLTSAEQSAGWVGLASALALGVGVPIAANHGALGKAPDWLMLMVEQMRAAALVDASPLDVEPDAEPDDGEPDADDDPPAPADG